MFFVSIFPIHQGLIETLGPSAGDSKTYTLFDMRPEIPIRVFWFHIWIDTDNNDPNSLDNHIHRPFIYIGETIHPKRVRSSKL